MSTPTVENNVQALADAQTKTGQAAAKIAKSGGQALSDSSNASVAAFQELTKAYQELAGKNSAKLANSIKELSAVKSSTEFVQLQQKLVKEAFDAALADSQHIADLTISVFNSAFAPIQKQIEAAQKGATH